MPTRLVSSAHLGEREVMRSWPCPCSPGSNLGQRRPSPPSVLMALFVRTGADDGRFYRRRRRRRSESRPAVASCISTNRPTGRQPALNPPALSTILADRPRSPPQPAATPPASPSLLQPLHVTHPCQPPRISHVIHLSRSHLP